MASETTLTTANDLSYSAMILANNILPAFYANNNAQFFVRQASLVGMPSKAHNFPTWPSLSAAAVAEATDLTNTAISTGVATVTAGEHGIMATITDLLSTSDIVDLGDYGRQLGMAMAELFQTDIFALSSGFSSSVGSTGVPLTELNVLEAVTTLENAKAPGPYVGALHPSQWEDFIGAVGGTLTPAGNQGTGVQAVTNLFGARPQGSRGEFYGIVWFTNTEVPTANAGADRGGMVVSPQYAIGNAEKWAIRVELERDASLRATEVVVTDARGEGELLDGAGVAIVTDA